MSHDWLVSNIPAVSGAWVLLPRGCPQSSRNATLLMQEGGVVYAIGYFDIHHLAVSRLSFLVQLSVRRYLIESMHTTIPQPLKSLFDVMSGGYSLIFEIQPFAARKAPLFLSPRLRQVRYQPTVSLHMCNLQLFKPA